MQEWSYLPTYPTAAIPTGHAVLNLGLSGLPGRSERRPTMDRWARHPLETIDEEEVTGVGAATEVPNQEWFCE